MTTTELRRHLTGGIECRATGGLETRIEHDDGSPKVKVGGTFAHTDQDTFIADGIGPIGGFNERLAPGAFDEAIKISRPVLLLNHGGLAMSKAPDTLRIFVTPEGHGGWQATVDTRQSQAADFLVCWENSVITGTSYAFKIAPGGETWSKDGTSRQIHRGGIQQIFDISPCQTPADDTTVTTVEGRTIFYAGAMPRNGAPRGRRMTTADLRAEIESYGSGKRPVRQMSSDDLRRDLDDVRARRFARAVWSPRTSR